MKKTILNIVVLLLIVSTTQAQNYKPNYLLTENAFISNNFIIQDSSGWFMRNQTSAISPVNFLANYKQHFGMGADDGFILKRTTNDDYPFMTAENKQTHERYNQTYKGVPVEFSEFFIHHKNNKVQTINCKVAEGLNMSVVPTLSEAQALTAAINFLGVNNVYAWQDTSWESDIKDLKEDSNATYFPSGILIISKINVDQNYNPSGFTLAWKFKIQSINPSFDITIYINAFNGAYIKQISNLYEGNTNLSYNYGNGVYIDTRWAGSINRHRLRSDDANEPRIWTKRIRQTSNGSIKPFGGDNYTNSSDWDDNWDNSKESETTPHWILTQTWKYFSEKFNFWGIDNLGTEINVLGGGNFENAFFSPPNLFIFGSTNQNHWGTKDVCSHEYTHGITFNTAGLVYQDESGALNESFSDIFGFEVERYLNGGIITNWDCNEDVKLLRHMNIPHSSPSISTIDPTPSCNYPSGHPSVYLGYNWYTGACDNGGVHNNSGVQNYWFYLLTSGSLGAANGTFNNINVDGIGADKARDITFYNLDNFIGNNSDYPAARLGSLNAANIIYNGICTNEYIQTNNAWAAVGLGSPILPLSVSGPSQIIHLGNGIVLGGYPIDYTAIGDRPPYTWIYNGPWSTSTNGGILNEIFSINNINGNYSFGTVQVNGKCESLSRIVKVFDFGGGNSTTSGGPDNGTIILSPNPTQGILGISINFPNSLPDANYNISMFDLNGALKFQQTYPYNEIENIDVSSFNAGVYILVAQEGNNLQSIRFIKE